MVHGQQSTAQPARGLHHLPTILRTGAVFAAYLVACLAAWCLALAVHFAFALAFPGAVSHPVSSGWTMLQVSGVLLSVLLLIHFGIRGHYTGRIPGWVVLQTLVTATALAALCDLVLHWMVSGSLAVHAVVLWIVLVPCILATRALVRLTLDAFGMWRLRTVVIGEGAAAEEVAAALNREPGLGFKVVGQACADEPGHGQPGWIERLVTTHRADFAVLAVSDARELDVIAGELNRLSMRFALAPHTAALQQVLHADVGAFFPDKVLRLQAGAVSPVGKALKGMFDASVALVLLVVLAPLLLAIGILVVLDGGPVLYGHRRVGENGRPFRCLKFRSMVTDSETVLRRVLDTDPAARLEWAETQKLRNDPRVTPVGHVLRQLSLDELPQLLNVLRGEMSLVGPRPIVEAEKARYGSNLAEYYATRPGITGLWQVSGRSNTSYERRVALDVWYARNWSLWRDIVILTKTVPAVVSRRGAS